MQNKLSVREIVALVAVSSITWGLAFMVNAKAFEIIDPMQVQAGRWTIGLLVLGGYVLIKCEKVNFRKPGIGILLIAGILQPGIYYLCESYGIKYTNSSVSAIFIATIPCAILLFNWLIYKHKTGIQGIACIVLAFSGVAVCTVFSPGFSIDGDLRGYFFMIGAVASAGLYAVFCAKVSENFTNTEITLLMVTMGAIMFNAANFGMGYGFSTYRAILANHVLLAEVVFLGVFCSAICYIAYNKLLASMNPALADNIVSNLITVIGAVAGIFIMEDPAGSYTAVGLAMTLAGVIMTSKYM